MLSPQINRSKGFRFRSTSNKAVNYVDEFQPSDSRTGRSSSPTLPSGDDSMPNHWFIFEHATFMELENRGIFLE
jgi:hypothetical protein